MQFIILVLAMIGAEAPEVLWSTVNSGGVYATVRVGDIDGDSVEDIVCGVDYMDPEPSLWCISGASGNSIWTSDQCGGFYRDKGLSPVPDVTGDGYADLVLAVPASDVVSNPCALLVSGASGEIEWFWNAFTGFPGGTGWGLSSTWLSDFTGDSYAEVVCGFSTTTQTGTGGVACLDGNTGELQWLRHTEDAVSDLLALPDITGDEVSDIAVGIGGSFYTDNTVMVLNGATGGLIWQTEGGGDVMSLCLVDRADTDPCIACCTFTGGVRCFSTGGEQVWQQTVSGILLDIDEGPDLNLDDTSELALAGDNGGCYCLSGADGSTVWNYPSGDNTWSVAWADSVMLEEDWTPCVAAGSVNGRTVSLINAVNGELVWDHQFDELVNNVTVVPSLGSSPSQVVIAGLQDQQPLPNHAWALATSLETSIEQFGNSGNYPVLLANPCSSPIIFTAPSQGWSAGIYDLTGREVESITLQESVLNASSALRPGCYFVLFSGDGVRVGHTVAVLPD